MDSRGFIAISKTFANVSYYSSWVALSFFANSYGQSLCLLGVHCLYRYCKITGFAFLRKYKQNKNFQKFSMAFWQMVWNFRGRFHAFLSFDSICGILRFIDEGRCFTTEIKILASSKYTPLLLLRSNYF